MKKGSLFLNRKPDFNIILFLGLYFLLKYGFYLYVGFTTPGGKLYLSWFAGYLNFPQWLTLIVSKTSKLSLQIAGYSAYQINAANVTITGSRGVTIAWGCLGIGAISLWISFIISHRINTKYKLKWIAAGIFFIFIINILRIDMIALSNHYSWSYFKSFNAHASFDLLTYIIILILMMIFAWAYNRQKRIRVNTA